MIYIFGLVIITISFEDDQRYANYSSTVVFENLHAYFEYGVFIKYVVHCYKTIRNNYHKSFCNSFRTQ